MNPILILAVVIAFVLSNAFSFVKGDKYRDTAWRAEIAEGKIVRMEKVREQESMWQGVVNETAKNYDIKVAGIQRNLDIALDSLRSRPGRGSGDVPSATGPACPCGTGATLCREDGEFLVREAARADKHREALSACYKVIDGTK